MHGFELISELRFLPDYKDLPVIVVTSRSGQKHQQQAKSLGATDYLTKPFSAAMLEAALERWGKRRGADHPTRGDGRFVTAGAALAAAAEAAHPATELVVVIACHGLLCTLPVRRVERLLLREAVSLQPPPGRRPRERRALPQVVYAAEEPFAAWNLGTMLGLPPVSTAWVLLRVGPATTRCPSPCARGPA